MEKKPPKHRRGGQTGKCEPDADLQNASDRLRSRYNAILTEPIPKRLRALVEQFRRANGGNDQD